MKRYLVEFVGDTADLEEFPRYFPDGDAYALSEGQTVFLTGPFFDSFETPADVLEAAEQILDEFVAVVLLLWPALRRPTLGAVCIEDESGQRARHIFVSVHDAARAKDYAEVVVDSMPVARAGPTEGQQLLAASRKATSAQAAMMIWADPNRTWPRLYRILEELESELKSSVSKVGLCSENQRERFNQSANSAAVAGKDARHASGKYKPPKKPMSLLEATSFVGGLIQQTLRHVLARSAP